MSRLTRDGTAENPSRETKFSDGANGDRGKLIFSVQLATSRIGNLTQLIHTLAICDDHLYIHTAERAPGAGPVVLKVVPVVVPVTNKCWWYCQVAQRYHVTSDTLGREFDPGKRDFSH